LFFHIRTTSIRGNSNTAQKSFNIRKQFFKKYCQNTTATREKLANAGLENYKKIKSEQLENIP